MNKYYYGPPGEEIYYETDLEAAADLYFDEACYNDEFSGSIEIVEMKPSKFVGRWCKNYLEFNPDCPGCEDYKPRNKKNGICTYLFYGLVETGRKWEYDGKTINKISGRNTKTG